VEKGKRKISVAHLLVVFLWLFNIIRSIYFFLTPSNIESAVTDYILVVLPTFIYFSAFTIILVLWATICLKEFSTISKALSWVSRVILIINVGFFLVFIIIVLVFQFSVIVPITQCKGRDVINLDAAYDTQQIVSIFYATLIAFISLAIGIAFLVFGVKLFYKSVDHIQKAHRKQKIAMLFTMTTVSAVGFILHCIFLLVLVGLSQPNIIFTFVGLEITEILPTIVILAVFKSQNKLYRSKSGVISERSSNYNSRIELSQSGS